MKQRLNDGLKVKYNVYKVSDGTMVNNCFVLRPDKDPAAIIALQTYAQATDNLDLSKDILRWVGSPQTIDPVHAAGACYCKECMHRNKSSCPAYDAPMNRTSLRIEYCSCGEPRTPPAE